MEQNALVDVVESMKQRKIEKIEQSMDELTQEVAKVNARLAEIEKLLKTSDKTYIK